MSLFARRTVERIQQDADEGEHTLHRTLNATQLVALGIGAIIGAGRFSLTGIAAAENAGPAVVDSFIVAAVAGALAGLCYSEFAAMIPVAGSAYTYAYATMGELVAWRNPALPERRGLAKVATVPAHRHAARIFRARQLRPRARHRQVPQFSHINDPHGGVDGQHRGMPQRVARSGLRAPTYRVVRDGASPRARPAPALETRAHPRPCRGSSRGGLWRVLPEFQPAALASRRLAL
jgi:hypothetical protein